MKTWTTLALIISGLSFVGYFQLVQHQQREEPPTSAALADHRVVPRDKKPAPQPAATKPALKFGEYPCPADCSEDKAGYRWAEENSITDPDDCTGSTVAFIEGCRVYAQQQAARIADY